MARIIELKLPCECASNAAVKDLLSCFQDVGSRLEKVILSSEDKTKARIVAKKLDDVELIIKRLTAEGVEASRMIKMKTAFAKSPAPTTPVPVAVANSTTSGRKAVKRVVEQLREAKTEPEQAPPAKPIHAEPEPGEILPEPTNESSETTCRYCLKTDHPTWNCMEPVTYTAVKSTFKGRAAEGWDWVDVGRNTIQGLCAGPVIKLVESPNFLNRMLTQEEISMVFSYLGGGVWCYWCGVQGHRKHHSHGPSDMCTKYKQNVTDDDLRRRRNFCSEFIGVNPRMQVEDLQQRILGLDEIRAARNERGGVGVRALHPAMSSGLMRTPPAASIEQIIRERTESSPARSSVLNKKGRYQDGPHNNNS